MNGNEKRFWEERLVRLEVIMEEHTKGARDRTTKIFEKIDKITTLINNLPCDVNREKLRGMDGKIRWLFALVTGVIVCGIVLGLWTQTLMGG